MSEVDRLSNSGLFPTLPIADRRSSKDDKERQQRPDLSGDKPANSADTQESGGAPRPPKSRIDEYA
jgi:hypothetical protein